MVLRRQVLKQIHQDIFNINSLLLAKIRVHNHNKNSPPVKKCSGVNQELNLHRSSTVYKPKQLLMNMWVDFDVRGKQEMDFFTVWSIIMDYGHFSQKQRIYLIMDLFLTNSQLFTSQDVNWWTEIMWITCVLLWCFYQLFLLSFWRHPFTAEHPLVSNGDAIINSSTSVPRRNTLNIALKVQMFGWTILSWYNTCQICNTILMLTTHL